MLQIIFSYKQESIPVGCIPPTWKLYMLQFQGPQPDFTLGSPPNEQV